MPFRSFLGVVYIKCLHTGPQQRASCYAHSMFGVCQRCPISNSILLLVSSGEVCVGMKGKYNMGGEGGRKGPNLDTNKKDPHVSIGGGERDTSYLKQRFKREELVLYLYIFD